MQWKKIHFLYQQDISFLVLFPDLSSVWCSPGLETAAYFLIPSLQREHAAAAAKLLQSCPTLCDTTDGSPPGSPVPGILQARTLEWVAIYFSNAWKWKVKVKLLSRVRLFATPWTAAYQAPPPMGFWDFPGKSTGVGCHCLIWLRHNSFLNLCFLNILFLNMHSFVNKVYLTKMQLSDKWCLSFDKNA